MASQYPPFSSSSEADNNAYNNMNHSSTSDSGDSSNVEELNVPNSSDEGTGTSQSVQRGCCKLYIGNLNPEVTEEVLKEFLTEKGVNMNHLVHLDLKGQYAFAEFSDQSTADKAIDQCHRKSLLNTIIKVEPSIRMDRSRPQRRYPSTQRKVIPPSTSGYELANAVNYIGDGSFRMDSGHSGTVSYVNTAYRQQVASVAPINYAMGAAPPAGALTARGKYLPPTGSPTGYMNSKNRLMPTFVNVINNPSATYIPPGPTGFYSQQFGHWKGNYLNKPECIFAYIPDSVVGALIGRKGANIRQIIHKSGATVKIQEYALKLDDIMRRVSINGAKESISEAMSLIFQKIAEERQVVGQNLSNMNLTTELAVPYEMVGRLIGKGGQHVRELQRVYFVRIHFLTEPDSALPQPPFGEVLCRISGSFYSVLECHEKLREMLKKAMTIADTKALVDAATSATANLSIHNTVPITMYQPNDMATQNSVPVMSSL